MVRQDGPGHHHTDGSKKDHGREVQVEIRVESDYQGFFDRYTNGKGLKPEYADTLFRFQIYPGGEDNGQFADEQLLFFYFLIANCYGKSQFGADIFLGQHLDESELISVGEGDYYRYFSFSLIQTEVEGIRGSVWVDGEPRLLHALGRRSDGISVETGRIFPALTIDRGSYEILQTPIDQDLWMRIRDGHSPSLPSRSTLLDMLIRLCKRYLFKCPGESNVYCDVRRRAFLSPDFYKLIEGIPIFTLVLFSEMDYHTRRDMLSELRGRISGNITLKELLEDYQESQDYEKFQEHMALMEKGINNKSLLLHRDDSRGRKYDEICKKIDEAGKDADKKIELEKELYDNYGLHPQVVVEMYDAISISEGLFQLMDNVVMHAGCGVLSIRMHDVSGNSPLKNRYPFYFGQYGQRKENGDAERSGMVKYYLEVRIGDVSGTNIPDKFRENNQGFEDSLSDLEKTVYDGIELSAFFNPTKDEKVIWDKFYSHSKNIVNHYGLQIFDSFLHSRDGYFQVVSGGQRYQNISDGKEGIGSSGFGYPGTTYTMLLPMNNRVSEDKNIYDSMLLYGADENMARLEGVSSHVFDFSEMEKPASGERAVFYERVSQKISNEAAGNNLLIFDLEKVRYLEGIIKGVLSYLFSEGYQDQEKERYIAFINCKTYQIIEIVRLISLSYDKAGMNRRMEKTQIFIRGKEVGEEILFYGNTLSDVGKNIMKIACMRGILYDNYQAVDALLDRR